MSPGINIRKFYLLPSNFSLLHLSLVLLFALCSPLQAQSLADIRVTDVRFSMERSPFGGDSWLTMEVLVDVRGNSARSAAVREFLDKVEFHVALANNISTQSQPNLEYFWTHVEAPTLKSESHRFSFSTGARQVLWFAKN
jgi:hypothetical protein